MNIWSQKSALIKLRTDRLKLSIQRTCPRTPKDAARAPAALGSSPGPDGGVPTENRLVLGCINADFCDQIFILQRFSRSTRFEHFHNFGISSDAKMQNLVELEECCKMTIWSQKSALIQPRTSLFSVTFGVQPHSVIRARGVVPARPASPP